MQEQVELLRELQGIDQELNEVRRGRQKLEDELAVLDSEQERVQGMVDSLAAELATLQEQQREFERSLALEQDNVAKAEGRLPAIKTQKEYVAVLKEIDTAKKVNKDIQDQIKAKNEEVETLARDKAEKDAELAAVTAQVGSRRTAIEGGLAEIDQTLADSGGKRDALLGQLAQPLRKRYQMLLDRRGGVAIVPARRGTCLGCNMQLPPQLFNSLFTCQEIQSCPHCSRLIYLSQED